MTLCAGVFGFALSRQAGSIHWRGKLRRRELLLRQAGDLGKDSSPALCFSSARLNGL